MFSANNPPTMTLQDCLTHVTGAPTSACWHRVVPNMWRISSGSWCTSITTRTRLTMTSPCCSWRSPGLPPSARWSSLCACHPRLTVSPTATAAGSLGGDIAPRRVSNAFGKSSLTYIPKGACLTRLVYMQWSENITIIIQHLMKKIYIH